MWSKWLSLSCMCRSRRDDLRCTRSWCANSVGHTSYCTTLFVKNFKLFMLCPVSKKIWGKEIVGLNRSFQTCFHSANLRHKPVFNCPMDNSFIQRLPYLILCRVLVFQDCCSFIHLWHLCFFVRTLAWSCCQTEIGLGMGRVRLPSFTPTNFKFHTKAASKQVQVRYLCRQNAWFTLTVTFFFSFRGAVKDPVLKFPYHHSLAMIMSFLCSVNILSNRQASSRVHVQGDSRSRLIKL